MGKEITAISLDPKVKEQAREILDKKKLTLSFYVEQSLIHLIEINKSHGGNDGTFRRKEEEKGSV